MKFAFLTALAASLVCTLAPQAPAQAGGNCSNTTATNIAAVVKQTGSYTRCGLGVEVFGLPISIGGAKCYRNQFLYPAHQECLGAVNPGTQCLPEATLAVQMEICECATLGVIHTGISLPKCSCSAAGVAGTVEDSQTVLCQGQD